MERLRGKESALPMKETQETWFNPWSGRPPGEVNGSPLQYSCLGNPMDRGALKATQQSMGSQRVQHD